MLEKIKQIIAEQERAPLPATVRDLRDILYELPKLLRARDRSGKGRANAIDRVGKYKGRR